ncbi:MAG: hypothetical protein U0237_12895 [Thermoleophilia bacterium]
MRTSLRRLAAASAVLAAIAVPASATPSGGELTYSLTVTSGNVFCSVSIGTTAHWTPEFNPSKVAAAFGPCRPAGKKSTSASGGVVFPTP